MKVHFVSIGGSVMHQLAIALKNKGYQVTGSDDEIVLPSKENLAQNGLLPAAMGWNAANITTDLDAVILGMHAHADNPELEAARLAGLKIYSFPEYIYQESKSKERVVIGGSHGKTTTTAMIMHVLKYAQKPFDYLVGAQIDGFDQSVNISDAPVLICEGDEYPASAIERRPKFHFLFPHIAVLTGIAWDHINIFPTFENYKEQFEIFIGKIEPGGMLIYNVADETLAALVVQSRRTDLTYQPYQVPEHQNINGTLSAAFNGIWAPLRVFGDHNLLNMQAAFLVCKQLGVPAATFAEAIQSFGGAARRLQLLASSGTSHIYRDFAHAPSKVKATVAAVKQQYPNSRLVAVLELHTFSSLSKQFLKEYTHSLDIADDAVVFYSHHALQLKKLPPIDNQDVLEGFATKNLLVFTDTAKLESWLVDQKMDNTILLLMSSGTFNGLDVCGYIANRFEKAVALK